MNIQTHETNDITVLSLSGRLDSNTSETAEQQIMAKIDGGSKKLVLDFKELDYISSAGLRVLLMTAKRLKAEQGAFALCNLQEQIREVFDISGFLPILTVVEDMDSAINKLNA